MDKEMIERCAKAIKDDWLTNRAENIDEFFKFLSIAAIKTMREPTDKMVLGADLYSSAEDSIGIYQAMIDAVINDA